jgi:hypothetical protein
VTFLLTVAELATKIRAEVFALDIAPVFADK